MPRVHVYADYHKEFFQHLVSFYIAVHLAEKAWLPLQPPIPFPSPDHRHGDDEEVYHDSYPEDDVVSDDNFGFHFHDDHDPLHHYEPTMGHTSNMPHPPNAPPPTGHNDHHQHAEL